MFTERRPGKSLQVGGQLEGFLPWDVVFWYWRPLSIYLWLLVTKYLNDHKNSFWPALTGRGVPRHPPPPPNSLPPWKHSYNKIVPMEIKLMPPHMLPYARHVNMHYHSPHFTTYKFSISQTSYKHNYTLPIYMTWCTDLVYRLITWPTWRRSLPQLKR